MTTKCYTCSLNVDGNENGIACDSCDSWYHFLCTTLEPNEFISYCDNEDLPWKCDNCTSRMHCGKCNHEFNNRLL